MTDGRLAVRWGYVWAAWAAVAVIFSGQNVVGSLAAGVRIDWSWAVYHEMLYWALWAAVTPLIFGAARRFRLGPDAGWRTWGPHLALVALIAPLHIGLAYSLHGLSLVALQAMAFADLPAWLAERRAAFLAIAITGIWKYAVVVGAYYAFDYYRNWRHEQRQASEFSLRAAHLEAQLARSQLAALRSQLQPHFLFNTLNSIAVLVRESPADAEATIRRLSDLLRITLECRDTERVSLRDEVAFLEAYLEIQRTRYEDRLQVEFDLQPEALDASVPFLILQPLVENAVRYGAGDRPGGGCVKILARIIDDRVRLEVRDRPLASLEQSEASGPTLSQGVGTGLHNVRERLAKSYGDAHRFEAGLRPDGGFAVLVEIPSSALTRTSASADGTP